MSYNLLLFPSIKTIAKDYSSFIQYLIQDNDATIFYDYFGEWWVWLWFIKCCKKIYAYCYS